MGVGLNKTHTIHDIILKARTEEPKAGFCGLGTGEMRRDCAGWLSGSRPIAGPLAVGSRLHVSCHCFVSHTSGPYHSG